jgi:AraC family transcriptional regulator of arabinose operon
MSYLVARPAAAMTRTRRPYSPISGIPIAVFRNEVAHRTDGRMSILAGAGTGFILKPRRREDYVDRVMASYVGLFVLRGRGRFVDWHGRSHDLAAGSFVQMLPGRRHSMILEPDGLWAEFYFTLGAGFVEAMIETGGVDPHQPVLRPGLHVSLIERFERHLHDVKHGRDGDVPSAMLRVHELLVELHRLDRLSRTPSPHARMIDEACRALGEDLHRPLHMASVAQRCNLSYERFRKVFREQIGEPPGEYRIRRRIDRARTLILQDGLSNKQVAAALGYPDPFTFSRQFRKYVGMSTRLFRRMG